MDDKGKFNGRCNKSDCTTGQPALWFNTSTREYYCEHDAAHINFWSKYDDGLLLCFKRTDTCNPEILQFGECPDGDFETPVIQNPDDRLPVMPRKVLSPVRIKRVNCNI